MSAAYWCRTLGGLGLYGAVADSQPLIGSSKPVAIIVYLALASQRRARRNHLAELFWPGLPLSTALHDLRQVLYRLRALTDGTDLLIGDDAEVALLPVIQFDFAEGEAAAERGEVERAVALLQGEFLQGFYAGESTELEHWIEAHRTRFREGWARAARAMAERQLAGGDPGRALELAEAVAARRPFDDGVMRLIMSALAESGRHASAVARYQGYVELLKTEVEDRPGVELAEYAQELERYVQSRPSPTAGLPFVGRAEQWSVLEAALEAAVKGAGSAILIEGSTGLGKTRLLAELGGRVEAAGGVVLTAKSYEVQQTVAYGAVGEALAGVVPRSEVAGLDGSWLAEAARILPELRERLPGIGEPAASGSPAAKRRLHQALARCVEAVAAEVPVLLAVDDVHWADAASLEVLHLMANRFRECRVVLVATYRPAELNPAARRFARSLVADRLAELVVIEAITERDVFDLLGALGRFDDSDVSAQIARHLHAHSGGNPLFLAELLETLAQRRMLWVTGGRWTLARGARIADVPHTLGKLMSDRLDRLAPWVRAAAETLAVVSDDVPVELLAQALQLSEPRAELALRVLEEERVARRAGPGVWELAHDEVRRLVYQGIPDERRRLLHEAVGLALEARGEAKRPGGMARLAHHFDHAGDLARAHRYALSAAAEAGTLAAEDAERMLLEVAAASGPRALPPGTGSRTRAVVRALRRNWIAAAGVALALVTLGSGAGLYVRSVLSREQPPAWRQGTLFVSDINTNITISHRVRWPRQSGDLATVEELGVPLAGDPPRLVLQSVTESGETHSKIFVVRGEDTIQLTFGLSDDAGATWAPDGQQFLFQRGWRASETRYQQNIFLMDSAGRILRSLTESPWQDSYATWSPDGTQFTFGRDSAGVSSVWIADSDGSHARNLTEEFALPTVPAKAAFAPDGRRVAVAYADTGSGMGAVYVLDLGGGTVRAVVGAPSRAVGLEPVWSPDARWLAYLAVRLDSNDLWVAAVDEPSTPTLVARLAQELRLGEWLDGSRRYVSSVSLDAPMVELQTGRGVRARAIARAPDGEVLRPVMRWSVGDKSVAEVDSLGFVVGRRGGSTTLVASAGGVRADTAMVTVSFAPVDTVFFEDWSSGLDTTRWIRFGQPQPVVREHVAPDGRSAFFNNGDYNHSSGAFSARTFQVGDDGLTLEVEGWLEFTGQHWQHWNVGFLAQPEVGQGPEITWDAAVVIWISGPEPTQPGGWTCANARIREKPPFEVPRWSRVALAIRPDGWCECWLDGRRVAAQPLPEGVRGQPLAVILSGLSVGTELYHGRVVVRRGVVY